MFLDDTCQLGVSLPGTGCLSWFLTPVGMDVFLALLAVPHPVYGTPKEQHPMRFSDWSSPGMFRGSCRWYLSLSLPRAGVTEVCPEDHHPGPAVQRRPCELAGLMIGKITSVPFLSLGC